MAVRDRGEGSLSYLAVTVVVAGLAAALATTGVDTRISSGVSAAVCRVSAADCAAQDDDQARGPANLLSQAAPSPGAPSPGTPASGTPASTPTEQSLTRDPQPGAGEVIAGRAEIEKMINGTQGGELALMDAKKHNTQIKYVSGDANYYSPSDNTITVGTNPKHLDTAAALLAQNAHLALLRDGLDPEKMERQEYIDRAMYNRWQSELWGVHMHQELRAKYDELPRDAQPVHDADFIYETAFNNAIDNHRPPLRRDTSEGLDAGNLAGREAVWASVKQRSQIATAAGLEWDRAKEVRDRNAKHWYCAWTWC